jgi:alanyl-tRNA synthetase
MLSDGVVPTNEGRGYILRRLIRRALRAYNKLTDEPSSLDFLIKEVTKLYSEPYPELDKNIDKITKLFKTEEDLFSKTLNKGIQEINTILETGELSAKQAFYLFETYGFPFELTQEIALENNITLNEEEFQQYFENHKIKSKGTSTKIDQNMRLDIDTNDFCGYETIDTVSEIYHVEPLENKSIIFTKINPFYFEAGGQISDEGKIRIDEKEYFVEKVVQSENGATGLVVDVNNVNIGDEVQLTVDDSFRNAVSKSHSAAHIVHSALRNILGDHVAQAGSNVAPGRFRFDFSHTQKVSDEELSDIFETANKVIFDDLEVNTNIMNIDKAKEEGALAFFGDKYEDDVRVVNIGSFSKELCGGTHVKNSHDVGLVVLTQESSIGSNLRRVEMLSGSHAYDFLNTAYKSYQDVADILKVQTSEVSTKLKQNLETLEEYKLKISNFRKDELTKLTQDYSSKSSKIGKYNVIVETISLENSNESREVALNIVNNFDVDICILFSNISGKTTIVGSTKPSIDLDISIITNDLSSLYSGGASKDPNLSIGGGPGKYDTAKAINAAKQFLTKLL